MTKIFMIKENGLQQVKPVITQHLAGVYGL